MQVYNIREEDINKFTAISKDSNDFRKTVQTLWKDGLSAAEWCFVIEEKGEIIGRVGYWTPLDNKKDIRIFGLFLPKRDNLQFIGQKLLNKSLKKMQKQGAKSVNYQLHLDESKNATLNKQILELIGMKQVQVKKSFRISNELYGGSINNRLTYKSLEEVGKEFFIEIIKEVTRGTLDQEDKLSVLNLGEQESAKNYFSSLKSIDFFSSENWFIGYKENNIIGLVVPQKLKDNLGTINYIGVLPKKRGQGYVIDLLDKGIKNLFNRNIQEIIADIDETNFPMENALLKIGFKENKRILVYSLTL